MVQKLLYNVNLLSTYKNIPGNTDQTVELLSSYFVTAALTILIVISLVLTFHSNGTAIHKVLGLLLLSIFVVFLWVFQTQFLFIYLVYILAFISAVLMLFLSVVLMLPVSTLSSKASRVLNNAPVLFILPSLGDISIDFIVFTLSVGFIFVTITYAWALYKGSSPKVLWKVLLNLLDVDNSATFMDECHSKYPKEMEWAAEKRNYYFRVVWFIRQRLPLYPTYFPEFAQHPSNSSKSSENLQPTALVWAVCAALHYATAFIAWTTAFMLYFANKLFYRQAISVIKGFKQSKNIAAKLARGLSDSLIQLYLFTNVLAIAFSTNFLNPTVSVPHKDFSDAVEYTQGLGVLKDLLYNQHGSFLIISTLVLLIALIGAAVMTKNTKSKN